MLQLLDSGFDLDFLSQHKKLWVGFSGGVDSTALLISLAKLPQLKAKLVAVHVNHNLNSKAKSWQQFCQTLCQSLAIPCYVEEIAPHAISDKNTEASARKARYQCFRKIIKNNDCLILAHHLEDQAETVLLRLFKGAGIDGLSAMETISYREHLTIYRPFLQTSKTRLIEYAQSQQLEWIEDSSNQDNKHDRNFIRNRVLPLIKERYPSVEKSLCRTASLCQDNQAYLAERIKNLYTKCLLNDHALSLTQLLNLSVIEQCLVIRYWLKILNTLPPSRARLNAFLNTLKSAQAEKQPLLHWSKYQLQKYKSGLYYRIYHPNEPLEHVQWPAPFKPFGQYHKNYLLTLEKVNSKANIYIPADAKLTISTRQGGEKIHIRSMTHKVKKLLQELELPPWQKAQLPFLFIDNHLAAIADFFISTKFNQPSKNNYYLKFEFKDYKI